MAERVRLAIVGCGGMGRRHLTGLTELSRTEFRNIDLVAVCDLNRQNAEDLAEEALEHLGVRPEVFTDAAQMVKEVELDGADCPTDTGSHHNAAALLLDLGLHTMCEKPLAITIRGCNKIIAAAERAGQNPLRRRELPARSDQPARQGADRRRRDRRPAVHHGERCRRARQHDYHAVAAPEDDRHDHARRGRPQRRHPPVLLRRCRQRLRAGAAVREDARQAEQRRAGRLLSEMGR